MHFEKSFMELKKGMTWIHYALGAAGLFFLFKWLMDMKYITATTNIWMMGAIFFAALLVIDRLIHLWIFHEKPFVELSRNKLLFVHYGLDTVGILFILQWLMDQKYLVSENLMVFGLVFFGVYVLVDRTSHAVLEFN
jgi:hypothetical protein